jgi:hypothetical protein
VNFWWAQGSLSEGNTLQLSTYVGSITTDCNILSRVEWLIRRGLVWAIGFIEPCTRITRDYRQYSAMTVVRTSQLTVAHAIGFSVFNSHTQETDLSQSRCHFKSHMKSSFHSLTSFLSLCSRCQFRRLDSVQFQAHIPVGWSPRNSTLHFRLLFCTLSRFWVCPFITPRHGPHRKHSLYCWGVYIAPLPSNRRPIFARWLAREFVYRVVA